MRTIIGFLFSVVFICSTGQLFAQAQGGDLCSSATLIDLTDNTLDDCVDGSGNEITDSDTGTETTSIGGSFAGKSNSGFFQTAASCAVSGTYQSGQPGENPDMWFKFSSISNTISIDIDESATSLTEVAFVLWENTTGNCSELTFRQCYKVPENEPSVVFDNLVEGGNYFLQVVDPSGAGTGSFEADIVSNQDCNQCRSRPVKLEVIAPDASGGYRNGIIASGTRVTFKMTVYKWREIGDNYLHGVGLDFSSNFDASTFNADIIPSPFPNNASSGDWDYYATMNKGGTDYGPGFFFDGALGDAGNDYPDNDPSDNFGDEGSYGDGDSIFFVFSITIDECDDPNSYDPNLIVDIQTYSDKETGSFSAGVACSDDHQFSYIRGVCCPELGPDTTITVCESDGAVDLDDLVQNELGSDDDGDWFLNYNTGSESGTSGTYTPGTSTAGVYTYEIESNSFLVCADTTQTVTIQEVEGYDLTLTSSENVICSDGEVDFDITSTSSENVEITYRIYETGNPGNTTGDQTLTLTGTNTNSIDEVQGSTYPNGITFEIIGSSFTGEPFCSFDPDLTKEVQVSAAFSPDEELTICSQNSAPDLSDYLEGIGYSNLTFYTDGTGNTSTAEPSYNSGGANSQEFFFEGDKAGISCPTAVGSITIIADDLATVNGFSDGASYSICDGESINVAYNISKSGYTKTYTIVSSTNVSGASGGTGDVNNTLSLTDPNSVGSVEYQVYGDHNTDANCDSEPKNFTVTINTIPSAPTGDLAYDVCKNAVFGGFENTTADLWSTSAGQTPPTGNAEPTVPTNVTGTLSYYARRSVNGCLGPISEISVTVKDGPNDFVANDLSACQGDADNPAINTSLVNPEAGVAYVFKQGATVTSGNTQPSTASTGVTSYTVTATKNGCEVGPKSFDYTINEKPEDPSIDDVEGCSGDAYEIEWSTSAPNGTELNWSMTGNGSVTGEVASGSATWAGSSQDVNFGTITNATGSDQVVTVTVWHELNGCNSEESTFEITVKKEVPAPIPQTYTVCEDTDPFSATAAAGASGDVVYYIDENGDTSTVAPIFDPTTPGNFTFTVFSVNEPCEGPDAEIEITVLEKPETPANFVRDYCLGFSGNPVQVNSGFPSNTLFYDDGTPRNQIDGDSIPELGGVGETVFYYRIVDAQGCQSDEGSITYRVTDELSISVDPDSAVGCSGIAETFNFSSDYNANFSWKMNSNGGMTGGPSSGTGGTANITLTNTTQDTLTAEFEVYAHLPDDCISDTLRFVLTILPDALPPQVTDVRYCLGDPTDPLTVDDDSEVLMWSSAPGVNPPDQFGAPTPSSANSGTFVYYVSQDSTGCRGEPAAVTVVIDTLPITPPVTNAQYCRNTSSVNPLSAQVTNSPGYTTTIYSDPGLNTVVPGNTIPDVSSAGTTTYYVDYTDGNDCSSATPASFTIVVVENPSITISPDSQAVCNGVTATYALSASPASASNTFHYQFESSNIAVTGADNGAETGSGVIKTVSHTSSDTAYVYYSAYVEDGNGCVSPTQPFVQTVFPVPTAPTPTHEEYCRVDNADPLEATGTGTIYYSDNPGSGSANADVPDLLSHTPNTNTAGTFYYNVLNQVGNCQSPYAQIEVVINPLTEEAVVQDIDLCEDEGTVSITEAIVSSSYPLEFYSDAAGNNSVASTFQFDVSSAYQATFYVKQTEPGECSSLLTPFTVTVHPHPEIGTDPDTLCSGEESNLRVYCTSGQSCTYTYTVSNANSITGASDGTGEFVRQVLTNPSSTTDDFVAYQFQATTTAGCKSDIIPDTALVRPNPIAPTGNDTSYCWGATAVPVSATGSYDLVFGQVEGDNNSNNFLPAAPTPNTEPNDISNYINNNPAMTLKNYIFYVAQVLNGCTGAVAAIHVDIDPLPDHPETNDIYVCEDAGEVVSIKDSAFTNVAGNTIHFYSDLPPVTPVAGDPVMDDSDPNNPPEYYVTQRDINGCESEGLRMPISIEKKPIISESDLVVCPRVPFSQTFPTDEPLSRIDWVVSSVPAGVSGAGSGSGSALLDTLYSSNLGGSDVVYTVTPYDNSSKECAGDPIPFVATCLGDPHAPNLDITNMKICQNYDPITVTATSDSAGATFKWYDESNNVVSNNNTYDPPTGTVGVNQEYYVTQTVNGCESQPTTLKVHVYESPDEPQTESFSFCKDENAGNLLDLLADNVDIVFFDNTSDPFSEAADQNPIPPTNVAPNIDQFYIRKKGEYEKAIDINPYLGYCYSSAAIVVVHTNPFPDVELASGSLEFCSGEQTNLVFESTVDAGNNTFDITVSNPAGGAGASNVSGLNEGSALIQTLTCTGSSPCTFTYNVTAIGKDPTNCSNTTEVFEVVVNPIPGAPTVSSPIEYCQNETADPLTATGGAGSTLTWSTSLNGTYTTTIPTPSTATVGTEDYFVKQTVNGCTGPASQIDVTTLALPSAPDYSDKDYCHNDTPVKVRTHVSATGGNSLTFYVDAAKSSVAGDQDPTPSTGTVGDNVQQYFVTQTDANTCESSVVTVNIDVYAIPVMNPVADVSICSGESVTPVFTSSAQGTFNTTVVSATEIVGAQNETGKSTFTHTLTNQNSTTDNVVTYEVTPIGPAPTFCVGDPVRFDVTVKHTPVAPTITTPVTYCKNESTVQLTVSGEAGATFTWENLSNNNITNTAPTPSSATAGSQIGRAHV